MCNACNNMCCGMDCFDGCGCDDCDNPDCHSLCDLCDAPLDECECGEFTGEWEE